MIKQTVIGLAILMVLSGSGFSEDIRTSAQSLQTIETESAQVLAEAATGSSSPSSRAEQTPSKPGSAIAQSCPAADPGEALCGYYGGYCRYCDVNYPHYCPSNDTCYQHFTGAQSGCGNSYVICGGAVN